MWKLIIGIVGGLVVILGGGTAVVLQSPIGAKLMGRESSQVGTPVTVTAAARGDLIRTVNAPGSVEPKIMVKISSQVSAEVLALPFREGDVVKAGDVVVRLDPQDLAARLASARAGLKSEQARLLGTEAGLINARLSFDRLRQLVETGDATQAELDGSEAQYLSALSSKQMAEHSIEQAQARVDENQERVDNTIIASPIDGVVTVLNLEVGETAIVGTMNNAGSIIMEIADLSEMLLKAMVDETNIAPIREGQAATIFINAYADRRYSGVVQNIALKRRVAFDGTGVFEVEIAIDIPEGERLYSGLTANTDIAVEEFYDVIKVPSQAVLDIRTEDLPEAIRAGNEHVEATKTYSRVVYRLIDGKAIATPVTVGPSDLTHTVIVGGLDADAVVVIGPYRELMELKHDKAIRDVDAKDDEDKQDEADEDSDADSTEDEGEGELASDGEAESVADQDG